MRGARLDELSIHFFPLRFTVLTTPSPTLSKAQCNRVNLMGLPGNDYQIDSLRLYPFFFKIKKKYC